VMSKGEVGMGIEGTIARVWRDVPVLGVAQWRRMEEHFALLRKWNPKVNLVGPSTLDTAPLKHYGESLFLAAGLPEGVRSVLDIGSGAGFPGFPLAVLHPTVSVVLIESDKRKAAFLRESCELPNLRVVSERMESYAGCVDAVVSRAVDPRLVLCWALERALHFGYVGATDDVRALCDEPGLLASQQRAIPWQLSSSALWCMFHVKRS